MKNQTEIAQARRRIRKRKTNRRLTDGNRSKPSRVSGYSLSRQELTTILRSVAFEILAARCSNKGIVLLFHEPGELTRRKWLDLGFTLPAGRTSVVWMSCDDATAMFGHDPITRRWMIADPEAGSLKFLLAIETNTALFTMRFHEDGTMELEQEPDLFPIP